MRYLFFCLSFLCMQGVFGQSNYDMYLSSGTIQLPENFKSKIKTPFGQDVSGQGYHYRLVQWYSLPSLEQQTALKNLKVVFESYIPQNAYVMAFPKGFDTKLLEGYPIRTISEIEPSWKMHPFISDPFQGHWAKEEGKVKVHISVRSKEALKVIAEKVRQSIGQNILSIDVSLHSFEIAASIDQMERIIAPMPEVAWIELMAEEGLPEDYHGKGMHRSAMLDTEGLGLNLTGEGIHVLNRDDGIVGPHIDFQGRMLNLTNDATGTHGDGVGGIMAGAGNLDPDVRGMAAGAKMYVVNYSSSFTGQTENLVRDSSVVVTNNSYSDGCNGGYTSTARGVDLQLNNYPSLLHVFSAGNSGTSDCNYGAGAGWGNITGGTKVAKNCIATANLGSNSTLASSSSRGPAHDGRIKPDIAAYGNGQRTTAPDNSYMGFSGTSAASPGIAGVTAQLYEAYEQQVGQLPPSALIKAILLNTADDIGNVGPDFSHGWGRVNAWRAYQLMNSQRFFEGTISQGITRQHGISIPSGVAEAKIMVYWPDPAAASGVSRALVNDIDAAVIAPNGQLNQPWILNTAPNATSLASPATKGVDRLNNMEQISITQPTAGTYTLTVTGFGIPVGTQKYYVVTEYIMANHVEVIYPNGNQGLEAGKSYYIHWDATSNATNFQLSYSIDDGATWITITTVTGSNRQYLWAIPNTVQTGKARIRVTQGTNSDVSNQSFVIAGAVPGVTISAFCPTEATVVWNNMAGIDSFEVFRLGEKYMESVGIATTNLLTFANTYLPTQPLWVAVSPIKNGKRGRRTNAISSNTLTCQLMADLSIAAILEPALSAFNLCEQNEVFPSITIRNESVQPTSGGTVHYKWGNRPIVTENLPNLAGSAQINFTFSTPFSLAGGNNAELRIWVDYPNDQVPSNDEVSKVLSVNDIINGSLTENFTSGVQGNPRWQIINPDNDDTWAATNVIQINGTQGGTAFLPYYSYTAAEQQDALQSAPIFMVNFGSPTLKFDWSYAQYAASYDDSLIVKVHRGCSPSGNGEELFRRGGAGLATAPIQASNFVPDAANQWQTVTFDMSAYKGDTVLIEFLGVNDYGNNVYIDNILLQQTFPPPVPLAIFSLSDTICFNEVVTLEGNTANNDNSTQYNWRISDGQFLQGIGPHNIAFSTAGLHWVELIASTLGGADTLRLYIESIAEPTANYGYVVSTSNLGQVDFNQLSIGAQSYFWDFGDGNTSSDAHPVHQFTSNGNYQVRLVVSGLCGSDTIAQSLSINIDQQPMASFAPPSNSAPCIHTTVTFQAANVQPTVNYTFLFGADASIASANGAGPHQVSFSNSGIKTIQLIAFNSRGNDTSTIVIDVLPTPVAAFSWNQALGSVNFINQSTNANSYVWQFGDGNTSSAALPMHSYLNSGMYDVQLTVTGTCGTETITQSLTINLDQQPVASILPPANLNPCISVSTNFEVASVQPTVNYTFYFGAAASIASANGAGPHQVSFSESGTQTIQLVASNSLGSDTASLQIEVLDLPLAQFTLDNNQGFDVSLTNQSSNATNYQWDFGDGSTSDSTNATHTYQQSGFYTVALLASNSCGVDTIQQTITVIGVIDLFLSLDTTEVCIGTPVSVAATVQDSGSQIQWVVGNAGSPSTMTGLGPHTITFSEPGTQVVIVTANNGFYSETDSLVFTVLPPPSANPTFQFTGITSCRFVSNSLNVNSLLWDFGDGNTSTSATATHDYGALGTFMVTLTVENECDRISYPLTIEILPPAPPQISILQPQMNDTLCVGEWFTLEASIDNGTYANEVLWDFGATAFYPTIDSLGPIQNYFQSTGVKTIWFQASNEGGITYDTLVVFVSALPVVSVSGNVNQRTFTAMNNSQGATHYLWDFGDGITSTLAQPTHTYANASVAYQILFTAYNHCGSVTDSLTANIISNTNDLKQKLEVQLMPNPVQEQLTIRVTSSSTFSAALQIYAINGKRFYAIPIKVVQGTQTLPVSVGSWPSGQYQLSISDGKSTAVWPFVKVD